MKANDLNALRDRAYRSACEHGFHDKELSNEHFIMLVITELAEAVDADRKGRKANVNEFNRWQKDFVPHTEEGKIRAFKEDFEAYLKDTVEDELADAAIRLLDLAGLQNIDIEDFEDEDIEDMSESCNEETFTESVYAISTMPIRYEYEYGYALETQLNRMLLAIFGLAKHLGVDLLWHIEQKMKYNETRERLHGKAY